MKMYILVGMIASGKSTYAQNAARHGLLCINDDAIYNMFHANNYTLYDPSLRLLYKSLENTAASLILAHGRSVIVDRGLNISARSRKRWLALAQSFDVPCEAIIFPLQDPATHARRRQEANGRGRDRVFWLKTAAAHRERYVVPSLNEGFSKIHEISFPEILSGKVIL